MPASISRLTTTLRSISIVFLWPVLAVAGPDADIFERDVRPLLIEHCYKCHSQEAGKSKGGLFLDSRSGWQTGGDSGPALMAGDPDASLLVRAIRYTDPDLEMPPDGKLSEQAIKTLEKWVETGAFDPREESAHKKNEAPTIDLTQGRQFWAFQAPQKSPPPPVRNSHWPENEIDHFILSRLEQAGLTPNEKASDRTLIRRLYFDLVGLPPTPSQMTEALALPTATRIETLVERLLASQHFGETWGRHWLDLARYSESTGGGRSALLPVAWRYRNYVIDAFNQDLPFNQFVREQIAGDLLPAQDDDQRARQLIATAFLVLGPKNLDLQDKELLRMNTVDEQIDTVSRVFMGLTVSCARCHDHKFDPIPAADYYALAGIFRSTRTLKRSNVSTLTHRDLPMSKAHQDALKIFQDRKRTLQKKIKRLKSTAATKTSSQLSQSEAALKSLEDDAPSPPPQTLGVRDEDDTDDYNLCIRGNVHQLGAQVPRGFLQVLSPPNAPEVTIPNGQSGRLELARWLSDDQHPLVARVLVNRIWHHLFGTGLVRTVDNFGSQGERPTHPELLDYLTTQFVEDGWSVKRLVRRLVQSRTYQLSSVLDADKTRIDAENQLRWRMPRRRLTAEAIRDSLLVVSGTLETRDVACLFPESAQKDTALQKASLDINQLINPPLRSIYIPVLREEGLNPLLKAFDFANPSFPVGNRNQSILPTQALYLMNSEFVMEQSQRAARRLIKDLPDHSTKQRLMEAYQRTLGRAPSTDEIELALNFLNHPQRPTSSATPPSTSAANIDPWANLFHSLFASLDFRYLK